MITRCVGGAMLDTLTASAVTASSATGRLRKKPTTGNEKKKTKRSGSKNKRPGRRPPPVSFVFLILSPHVFVRFNGHRPRRRMHARHTRCILYSTEIKYRAGQYSPFWLCSDRVASTNSITGRGLRCKQVYISLLTASGALYKRRALPTDAARYPKNGMNVTLCAGPGLRAPNSVRFLAVRLRARVAALSETMSGGTKENEQKQQREQYGWCVIGLVYDHGLRILQPLTITKRTVRPPSRRVCK